MKTKKCYMCKHRLPLSNFAKHPSRKDGLQSQCKECQREYRRQHYLSNRQKYIDKAKRISQEFAQWYKKYKTQFQCVECGENHPACIQFHHANDDKLMDVSRLVSKGNKQKVIDEIAKCVPLCANCHFKLHWND